MLESGMETRKVQVCGNSTYVISLPKTWIESRGVKKGDGLWLHMHSDGSILLIPDSNKNNLDNLRIGVIETEDNMENIVRRFIGLYLAGYDIIRFKSRSGCLTSREKNIIKKIIGMVSGFEVVDEDRETFTIQDLLDQSVFFQEKIIRRMHLITKMMLSNSLIFLEGDDNSLLEDVESRDDEVDRLYWMIARQYNLILQDISLAEKVNITPNQGLSYLLISKSLERIADHAMKIAINIRSIGNKDEKLATEIKTIGEKLINLMNHSISAFFFGKLEDMNDILNRAENLELDIQNLTASIMGSAGETSTIVSYAYILDSLSRICSYTKDIAETAINNHFLTIDASLEGK